MTRIRCVVVVEEEEVGKRSRVMVFAVAGVIQRGLIFLRERSAAAMTGLHHKNIICDVIYTCYIYIYIYIYICIYYIYIYMCVYIYIISTYCVCVCVRERESVSSFCAAMLGLYHTSTQVYDVIYI
jgi:hypothetical protein